MDTVRAFVGCLLDIGTTRKVADLGRSMRKAAEATGWQASWVPPPNLHVTLKWLGDVDAGLVAPLSDALASVAARSVPLRLQVAGISAFPRPDDPKVVFAEIARGHEGLAALARAVDEALEGVGIPRETRGFHGHVTLARVRSPGGPLRAIVPAMADCGTAMVTEITLYRSDLVRAGAEYHALARHLLGPPIPEPAQAASPGRPQGHTQGHTQGQSSGNPDVRRRDGQ